MRGLGLQGPIAVAPLALCPCVVLDTVPLAIGMAALLVLETVPLAIGMAALLELDTAPLAIGVAALLVLDTAPLAIGMAAFSLGRGGALGHLSCRSPIAVVVRPGPVA